MLHGSYNAHDASECKTLQAQAKNLKGDNGGSNKNGKSHNKSWKNKAKDETDDLKKELAALVKKATQLIKQQELNAIELTRKVESIDPFGSAHQVTSVRLHESGAISKH